jgi:integrase
MTATRLMCSTDTQARKLPAPSTGYVLISVKDARGLSLRITAQDSRSWVFTYRPKATGLQRRYTIGSLQQWPLAAARERAKELGRMVDTGGDPLKAERDERAAPTIAELVERFVEEHVSGLRSKVTTMHHLRNYVLPHFGTMKVKDIEFSDVDRLHRSIVKDGKNATGNRVAATLSKMFSFAVQRKMRADNPCKGIQRAHEEGRTRYLTEAETAALTAALAKRGPDHASANAIRLLILTGARRGEVLRSTWSQFDLTQAIWVKPSSHTKTKRQHRVPLSGAALTILASMWGKAKAEGRASPDDPLFSSRYGSNATQIDLKNFWQSLCQEAGITGLRVHDLRHSYASVLASSGLSLPIIGALLGHTTPSTTARYSHLFDQPLRAATERAASVITAAGKAPSAGAEVVDIGRTRHNQI